MVLNVYIKHLFLLFNQLVFLFYNIKRWVGSNTFLSHTTKEHYLKLFYCLTSSSNCHYILQILTMHFLFLLFLNVCTVYTFE